MSIFLHKFKPGAVLRVTGEDAGDYLQSQCSADLTPSHENLATYGLWLSRKGKVEGDGFVLRNSDEDFLIISYHCSSEALRQKIIANAIADDVEIEDQSLLCSGISIWGEGVTHLMEKLSRPLPQQSNWTAMGTIRVFPGRRSRENGFDLVGPTEAIIPLLDEMRSLVTEQGGCELDENEVHFARIDQRIPSIPDEIGPNDLPQEGFLEKKAVSFDKGCFLGQEVMARLRSLGGVQRRLWVVKPMKTGLSAPSELFVEGRPAGLLKTRYSKGDKEIGAAMLRIKYVQKAIINGISTEPNEKPSIVLLHEFNF